MFLVRHCIITDLQFSFSPLEFDVALLLKS